MMKLHFEIPTELMSGLKKMPDSVGEVMSEVGQKWHATMLTGHFGSGAHGQYGYAARNPFYQVSRKKKNKPDLVFTGAMKNEMTSAAQFKQGSKMATVKVTARTLNFCPNMPNSEDAEYVPHVRKKDNKTIKYPNLKREVRIVLPDEIERLSIAAMEGILKRLSVI